MFFASCKFKPGKLACALWSRRQRMDNTNITIECWGYGNFVDLMCTQGSCDCLSWGFAWFEASACIRRDSDALWPRHPRRSLLSRSCIGRGNPRGSSLYGHPRIRRDIFLLPWASLFGKAWNWDPYYTLAEKKNGLRTSFPGRRDRLFPMVRATGLEPARDFPCAPKSNGCLVQLRTDPQKSTFIVHKVSSARLPSVSGVQNTRDSRS